MALKGTETKPTLIGGAAAIPLPARGDMPGEGRMPMSAEEQAGDDPVQAGAPDSAETILCYRTALRIVRRIGDQVRRACGEDIRRIVMYDNAVFDAVAAYQSVMARMALLHQGLADVLAGEGDAGVAAVQSAIQPLDAVGGGAKGLFDILATVRAPRARGAEGLDTLALFAEIADTVRSKRPEIEMIYPELFLPLRVLNEPGGVFSLTQDSALVHSVRDLQSCLYSGGDAARELEAHTGRSAEENRRLDTLRALNAQTQALIEQITHVDDRTGRAALTPLLQAERLSALVQSAEGGTALLYLRVVASGGSRKLEKRWRGVRVLHSAASVISYVLYGPDGRMKSGQTYYCATPYSEDLHGQGERYFENI